MERCFVNGAMVGQRPSSDAARAFSSTSAIVPPVTQLPPTHRTGASASQSGAVAALKIGRAHVELQSLMRISYAVFCLKKKKKQHKHIKIRETIKQTV